MKTQVMVCTQCSKEVSLLHNYYEPNYSHEVKERSRKETSGEREDRLFEASDKSNEEDN